MKFLHHAAVTLLFGCLLHPFSSSSSAVNALEGVLLGQLEMEMGSRSNTNPNELLVQVIVQTEIFLNDAFTAIYRDTDYEFSHTSLSVTTYSINSAVSGKDNGAGSYIASMDLAGTIFFGDAPPQEQVSTVISAAFQQQNQLFLQSLVLSKDPFLQDINYAIVRVVKNSNTANTNNQANAARNQESSELDSWMLAIIVGAGTFIVVFFCCLLFVCFTPLSELQPDDIEHQGSGGSGKQSNKIQPISTKDTSDNASDDGIEFWDEVRNGDDPERPTPTSLSPVHSITSQDSSRFTYNPKSGRSSEIGTGGGSFLSGDPASETEADTLDIEAWEQGSSVNRSSNMPFGHDISAIEKQKDLSLIEEGDFEDMTPHKPVATNVIALQQQQIKGQYTVSARQGQAAVVDTDRRRGGRSTVSQQRLVGNINNSSSGVSTLSKARPPKVSTNNESNRKNKKNNKKNKNKSATNEVINDLNDLSAQFDKYRGGIHSAN